MRDSWSPHILLLFLAIMLWWNAISTPHLRRDRSAGTCRPPPLKRRDVSGLPLDWSCLLKFIRVLLCFPFYLSLIAPLASGALTSGPGVSPPPRDPPALPDGPYTWWSASPLSSDRSSRLLAEWKVRFQISLHRVIKRARASQASSCDQFHVIDVQRLEGLFFRIILFQNWDLFQAAIWWNKS